MNKKKARRASERTGPIRSRRRAAPERATPPACIDLDVRATIVRAADMHRALLERLDDGAPLAIDGSRVEEIDTAMLQLLVSLWRSAAERGMVCTWRGVSDVLRQTASLLGLTEVLHFPDAESRGDHGNAVA